MLPNILSKNKKKRRGAERDASNTPDQGSVADIMKIAMRNLVRDWKERGVLYDFFKGTGKAKMCSQIHDELLVELRDDFSEEGAADVKRHMENAVKLLVPMKTDGGFGTNWLDAH
jgi:DNA polymerase-1